MTRLMLRFFPRAWRTRYGEELIDLVSETGLTPRGAVDIARAGLLERARAARAALIGGVSMTFGPAWRHPTAWAVVGAVILAPTLSLLALSAMNTGSDPLNSLLNSQRLADLVLVLAPAVAAFFAGVPIVRIGFNQADGASEASLSVRLRALNVVVVVVALAIGSFLVGHIVFESVMQVGS